MEKVVSLAKRRGFIFPSSEIYGGITGFWDYGPLGAELKNNIKREWWKTMVYEREDMVGIDASIIMNPEVWKASGHLESLTDPLVECKICHERFRADHDENLEEHEKEHQSKGEKVSWTESRVFNLMTEVLLGATEPKQKAYLRGEITQGVFTNFKNIVSTSRVKIPFGVAQIGKAFRNEITPGNFTYRSREFEQMEVEYFIKPDEKEGKKFFNYWKKERLQWYLKLGIKKANLRFRTHEPDERAHYARFAEDIEYNAPFGWKEFEGIHHRGDWDLSQHKIKYQDPDTGEEYTPWVIETSGGVDRTALFFLIDAYSEDDDRVVLKLHPSLAPYKVAVFPLLANKPELVNLAREIFSHLKSDLPYPIVWDDRGNIGKRYYSQDEIGTPYCVTVDYQSLDDKTVTVRDRDSMEQERIKTAELTEYLQKKLK
ncbi:MAG: glycine--tRNA ligase [Candidatus Colwellbacteria bacterium]|nr:glycine--tRNA ligase [Candidatus Colwellbacteria bacterium]